MKGVIDYIKETILCIIVFLVIALIYMVISLGFKSVFSGGELIDIDEEVASSGSIEEFIDYLSSKESVKKETGEELNSMLKQHDDEIREEYESEIEDYKAQIEELEWGIEELRDEIEYLGYDPIY